MARKKSKNQVIVRISVENGIPRVSQLTAKEEEEFYKKHPNVELPIYSPEDVRRGLEEVEKEVGTTHPESQSPEKLIPGPSAISLVNDHSAR
jgi:hypothetical protein